MPGRKMITARALIAIFLPAIFLLSIVCISGEVRIEIACPDINSRVRAPHFLMI
jgi:hypothetical protein